MPAHKDFKRLVRGRMQKTGESYTAARTQLLKKRPPSRSAAPAAAQPVAPPPKPEYAALAGMSDAAVKAKTGCNWEKWVMALDYAKADGWSHRAIAEHIRDKYKVPDWWAQMVTVGYERIKGLRERGQRRDGSYEAARSKTVRAPVGALYRALRDARVRRKWLPGVAAEVRTATPDRSVRMTWPDGTSVEAWLTAKGPAKAQVQIQHRKLPSREAAAAQKAYWGERLEALAALLSAAG